MREELRIRAEREVYSDSVNLWVRKGNLSCTDLTMVEVEEGMMPPNTPLRVSTSEAQALANELYRLGFEPSGTESNKGEIKALSYHLEDMRTLVFNKNK